jgi:hypothetical protein
LWPGNKSAAFTPYGLSGFTASAYGTDDTNKSNNRWYAEFAGSDIKPGFYGDRATERGTKTKKMIGSTKK